MVLSIAQNGDGGGSDTIAWIGLFIATTSLVVGIASLIWHWVKTRLEWRAKPWVEVRVQPFGPSAGDSLTVFVVNVGHQPLYVRAVSLRTEAGNTLSEAFLVPEGHHIDDEMPALLRHQARTYWRPVANLARVEPEIERASVIVEGNAPKQVWRFAERQVLDCARQVGEVKVSPGHIASDAPR